MGDMADYHMEQIEYALGKPCNRLKICRFCGTTGLHWEMVKDKYRLHYKDGREHYCMGGIVIETVRRKRI